MFQDLVRIPSSQGAKWNTWFRCFLFYDWDRTDPKTGNHRDLQIDDAFACIDFDQVNIVESVFY